jgi:hypothetical protein
MIDLGGKIKLNGFEDLDPPTLIVIKKLVGNYTKQIIIKNPDFSELIINLENIDNNHKIETNLIKNSGEKKAKSVDRNLFFAISKALEEIYNK